MPSQTLASWHEWDINITVPQILLHADVSQVASLIAPRPLLVVDGRYFGNRKLSVAEVRAKLHSCQRGYEVLGSSGRLSVVESADRSDLVRWFDTQFAGRP